MYTSNPPPRHNFTTIPRIRSERPAFEAHYPHMLARLEAEAHAGPRRGPLHKKFGSLVGTSEKRAGLKDPDPSGDLRPDMSRSVRGR